jgi:hypothetical protein
VSAEELRKVLREGPFAFKSVKVREATLSDYPYEGFYCNFIVDDELYDQWVLVPSTSSSRPTVREIAERLELDLLRRLHKERREHEEGQGES